MTSSLSERPRDALTSESSTTHRSLYFRTVWQLLGWTMLGAIAWLSLTPHPPAPPSFLGWDKAQHFLAYSGLMFWFRQAFARLWRWPFFLVFFGTTLELLQGLTEARTTDMFDLAANSIGVGAGLAIASTRAGHTLATLDRWLRVALDDISGRKSAR